MMGDLHIKEHGIYERRDGKIVAVQERLFGTYSFRLHGLLYTGNGEYRRFDPCHPFDLIREIVVGEGWRPWNGGDCPVSKLAVADVAHRNGVVYERSTRDNWGSWHHIGDDFDIVAFRVVDEAKIPKPAPGPTAIEPTTQPFTRHQIYNANALGMVVRLDDYHERTAELIAANNRCIERARAAEAKAMRLAAAAEASEKALADECRKSEAYQVTIAVQAETIETLQKMQTRLIAEREEARSQRNDYARRLGPGWSLSSPDFRVGALVAKTSGYRFPGEVRSVYRTRKGEWRYVVECTAAEAEGCQHIFNGSQLTVRQESVDA